MKFRFLFAILPVFVIVAFCGCGISVEELTKNYLAELHNHYFVGSTQNFRVSMWSGTREEPYEPNGVRENLVDFCVLSVVPIGDVNTFGLGYTVEINDKTYNGEFEQSPFDRSLAADLETQISDTDSIFVYIIVDGVSEISKMECISCDFAINNVAALNIAAENIGENILTLADNGNKSIEGYCKIISTDRNLGVYFWYVRFINTDGDDIAIVIDTTSGEIMAKKL